MPVQGLDHVNIRSTDIAASVRFYTEVLGFTYRRSPEVMGHRGHWLEDEAGRAIIHLRQREAEPGTGAVDHIALACQGKAEMLARLAERGIEYSMIDNLFPGLTQLVLRDPHGIAIELQFSGE